MLMNDVPLVLSSPTLMRCMSVCSEEMHEVCLPVPLVPNFEYATAMSLDVLTCVCLIVGTSVDGLQWEISNSPLSKLRQARSATKQSLRKRVSQELKGSSNAFC